MFLRSTFTATLTPDRSSASTLGAIWTSRHKAKPAPLTNAQAARLKMEKEARYQQALEAACELDFSDIYKEPASFLYLVVAFVIGTLGCAVFYALLFHGADVLHVLRGALTGGR